MKVKRESKMSNTFQLRPTELKLLDRINIKVNLYINQQIFIKYKNLFKGSIF